MLINCQLTVLIYIVYNTAFKILNITNNVINIIINVLSDYKYIKNY